MKKFILILFLIGCSQNKNSIKIVQKEEFQYLLNQGKITKEIIEQDADDIMFQLGEFPAEMTCLDSRDFAKLVVVYEENVRGASQDQITWLLNSMYQQS